MKHWTYYMLRIVQEINYRFCKVARKGDRPKGRNSICRYKIERLQNIKVENSDRGIGINKRYPAGKQIVLETTACDIEIDVLYRRQAILPHMTVYGISGVDIYIRDKESYKWVQCVAPDTIIQMHTHRTIYLGEKKEKQVVMFLPPYAEIHRIQITCNESEKLVEMKDPHKKKIVFYGSSITQGCAASRPGVSFCNLIAKRLDVECINYGFSESAKGQKYIIDAAMKEQPICYIMEYDHNATLDQLRKTHLSVYKNIRKNDRNTPVYFLSRFSGSISISDTENDERIRIIEETTRYAKQCGDYNTFFICGKNILRNQTDCFTDDRHPNDYGMQQIAELLCESICKKRLLM